MRRVARRLGDGTAGGVDATQLKLLQQSTLKTTKVSALNYLIINYDPVAKQWLTQATPQQPPLSGMVPGGPNPT
jgi:hypothetical protein